MKTFLVHPDRYELLKKLCYSEDGKSIKPFTEFGLKIVQCSWLPLVDSEGKDVLGFWFDENNLRMLPYAERGNSEKDIHDHGNEM